MIKLSEFLGGGGGLKPFNDLGTVTGTVNLDVSEFGSFRVKQGAGAITLNVTGKAADTAGYVELFFYPDLEQAVTISGADLVDNGYKSLIGSMTALNYDSISFSVAAQDNTPFGIAFNNDGSKMYMSAGGTVYQYTLSTLFDLSTASYNSVSFDVSGEAVNPADIAFSGDGSKMYILSSGFWVVQYTLSTPFNISTASYDSVNLRVDSQDDDARGIAFNNDGSKMYMVGFFTDRVYQYNLSTPFQLSTASYNSVNFSVSGQATSPYAIAFSGDGSKMYILGSSTNDSVYQYTLSTQFDLSTASYDYVSFYVYEQDTSPFGIAFNNEGSKMYMVGVTGDRVYQYTAEYEIAPPFLYQIIHTGTAATFNTLESEYTIEEAT